jgi:hypothetical protein
MPKKPKTPSRKRLKEAEKTRKAPITMKIYGRNFPTIISAGSRPKPEPKPEVIGPVRQRFREAYKEAYGNGHRDDA